MEQQINYSPKLTHKRYWLRGGLIGLIIFAIVAIADFSLLCDFGSHFYEPCGLFMFFASLSLTMITSNLSGATSYIFGVILSLLLYFLAGVYLGRIFQRTKYGKEGNN